MKLGLSSSCFYPLLTEKSLELIGKNKIKTTEIFFNANCELEKNFVKELKNIKDFYDINIISVHPTMSLAESFMLFSAYERRKEEGLDSFKRYGEICAELDAQYVILHGGKPNGILNDEQYFERFIEISNCTKDGGGTLLQENVAKFRAGDFRFLKKMADYLKDEAKFCIDIKQCIRGGYSPFDTISLLKGKIKHIHLSDHNEKKDCLIPSNGNFDFVEFISFAKENGFCGNMMIEVYRDAYDDYKELFDSYFWLKNKIIK